MKLAWVTDPHFDTCSKTKFKEFGRRLQAEVEGVIFTGDLSDGKPVKYLHRFRRFFTGNVFFVLGNHDYYYGSFADRDIELSHHRLPKTFYLTRAAPMELTPSVALVGEDGWYDGRNGVLDWSIAMRDFGNIQDLYAARQIASTANPQIRGMLFQERLRLMADVRVERLRPKLEAAAAKYPTVLVATHFPPFPENARHKGVIHPTSLPYYSSKAMGDLLYRTAMENPECRIICLCGHNHDENEFKPVDNLEVYTGRGDYRRLFFHRILHVEATVTMETPAESEIRPDLPLLTAT